MEVIKNRLVVYSREKCGYCVKSKQLLSSNNIPFTEIKLNPEHNDYEKQTTNLFLITSILYYMIIFI